MAKRRGARLDRRASRPIQPAADESGCLGLCPICARPVMAGASANRHHWQPRCKGGRDWSWLHRVCHRKIHSLWTETELLRLYDNPEKILATQEMARFVGWVQRKHPEFYDGSMDRRR